MKHRISKLKIEYNEIGTDNRTSAELILPTVAANKIISFAFDWKENWGGSVEDIERLLDELKRVSNGEQQ